MKIGVLTVLLANKPLEEALDYLKDLGVEAVEIGCGAYPGTAHCNPDVLLSSDRKLKAFKEAISSRGLILSALSVHGNPIHPNKKIAKAHHQDFEKAVKLARKLDVERVLTFSGCPGSDPHAMLPSWITAPLATGVSRSVRLAVERACHSLLEGYGQICQEQWNPKDRFGNASESRRLQCGVASKAQKRGGP